MKPEPKPWHVDSLSDVLFSLLKNNPKRSIIAKQWMALCEREPDPMIRFQFLSIQLGRLAFGTLTAADDISASRDHSQAKETQR